jgi:hypothetical protein
MPELGLQIRAYYEDIVERVDPMEQPAPSRRGMVWRPIVVVVAAIVAVAVAIGVVPLLTVLVGDDPAVDEPTSTTTSTTSTTLPTPSTTLAGLPPVPPEGEAVATPSLLVPDLVSVEAAPWGYVATSIDLDSGMGGLWVSQDASGWTAVSLPEGFQPSLGARSLSVWDDRVILLGFVEEDPEDPDAPMSPVFLTTADGETWEQVAIEIPDVPWGVETVAGDLVILAASSPERQGWPDRIYRTADGDVWTAENIPEGLLGDQDGFVGLDVFETGDGRLGLISRQFDGTVATYMRDAAGEWSQHVQTLPAYRTFAVTAAGSHLVVAAGGLRGEPVASRTVIYRWESDGWVDSSQAEERSFSDLTFDGRRIVAVGVDDHLLPGVWESTTSGISWQRIAGGPETLGERMPDIIGEPWRATAETVFRLRGEYRVEYVTRPAAQGDGGQILATDPEPGATLAFGQDITILVTEVEPTDAGPAPWSRTALSQDEVPEVLIRGWSDPENDQACPAIGLVDQDDDATPRLAGGKFAVSYDNPDGPGTRGDSSVCVDCGRSAYGVPFCTDFPPDRVLQDWAMLPAYHIEWDDGSMAILPRPHETLDIRMNDPLTGEPVAPQWTAAVWFADNCYYRVWSWLGPEHLLGILEDLRYIDGLAPP